MKPVKQDFFNRIHTHTCAPTQSNYKSGIKKQTKLRDPLKPSSTAVPKIKWLPCNKAQGDKAMRGHNKTLLNMNFKPLN